MAVAAAYKTSEVGPIPTDWDVKRLGELGDVVRGGSPRPAGDARYFGGDFIPWLTVASLTGIPESQLFVTKTQSGLTELGSHYSRTLPSGVLAIVNSGAKTLGVAKILAMACCANDGIAAIINQDTGDKRFLAYYLNSQTKRLREVVAAGNDQLNLNTGRIAAIPVPYPTQAEQTAIANAIEDIDALLNASRKLLEKKRSVKEAAAHLLLTGKSRLPGFREPWLITSLGAVGSFRKGSGVKKDEAASGELACIRYGEIYTHHHNVVRQIHSWISPTVASAATKIQAGDILFAASGETKAEIGKAVAFTGDHECYAGGDIIVLSPRGCDAVFLGHYLNTPDIVRQKSRGGHGDAVVHINAASLGDVEVKIPGLSEQQAIARVLTDMDLELEALTSRLAKTRALKLAVSQELLTGRVRLPLPEPTHA